VKVGSLLAVSPDFPEQFSQQSAPPPEHLLRLLVLSCFITSGGFLMSVVKVLGKTNALTAITRIKAGEAGALRETLHRLN
jgi:hypothetical protein